MKLYLAGPMSNLPEWNFPAFHAAAAKLRADGHEVINPAELNPDTTMEWHQCMRVDIAALVTCEGIALLPGWENSKGARAEFATAAALGLKVFEMRKIV